MVGPYLKELCFLMFNIDVTDILAHDNFDKQALENLAS